MLGDDIKRPLLSIRTKLPLLVGAVVVAVVVALGWSSYREVRRLAAESAENRMRSATTELRTLLTQQRQNLDRVIDSLIDDSRLTTALRRNERPSLATLETIERWLGSQVAVVATELWTSSGTRVYTTGDGPPAEGRGPAILTPEEMPTPGYTPFDIISDTVLYQITRPVVDGADTVGMFNQTRRLVGSPGAREQFRALTGVDARLLVGSPTTGVWHDLSGISAAPPIGARDTGVVRYTVDGADYLAMLEIVPTTPWVVGVEFRRDSVLAESGAFLRRLLYTGAVVTLLGLAGGWIMSRRITVPLNRLTTAVREFARGQVTTRVDIRRNDELGQLGRAFNAMATQVGDQQTELAQTNATLRESQERFRLVASGTLDGLWDWNIATGTTFYSPRFRELLDHRVTSDFLDTLGAHLHPDDRDATFTAIEGHLERRDPLDLEARFLASSGDVRWFRIRGQAVWEASGTGAASRLAGSIIEITRRRLAESEVRELNAALERRVQERTAALTAANAELEAFTYSVSHDLRAPLRQANGFAQLLAEDFGDQLPEEAHHYVRRIQSSATRMSQLVDDLLRLSRVGRQRIEARPVAVTEIVEAVRSDLPDEIDSRAVDLRVGPLPTVTCDPTLLKQVFVNLLHNAVKYTRPRPKAVIEVGTAAGNHETVLYVRDNGVGFDPNHADRLFGVFQRLHRAEDFEGTGVGLAIVQRIMHRHGGRVWAESTVDGGATFYIALPITEPAPKDTSPTT